MSGLPGIASNDFPDGIIGYPYLGFFQTVLLQLLGEQMILGDHQLLFIGIGAQFNDLHTVQQGSGHSVQGIGRGDEQNI